MKRRIFSLAMAVSFSSFLAIQAPEASAAGSQKLHRFDFRLEGVSCARCIINIRTALRASKGVSRCELALRKPYGGVIVYDSSLTDLKKLTQITETADKKSTVILKDGSDQSIEKAPNVLVPKITSLVKS